MPESGASRATRFADRVRGYAPALVPLIVGFLLLLAVILVLGLKTASKMRDVGSNARILTQGYSQHLIILLDLRLKLVNLNNEARVRDAEARGQLTPPLNLPLDKARDEVRAVYKTLGPPPMNVDPDQWEKFKAAVQSYIEVTEDKREYSLKGFDRYIAVENHFKKLIPAAEDRYNYVAQDMQEAQFEANKTILKWIILAVIVGALVAVGTIWQVQRHFSQMRHSVLETRRERTFTTQLLEGMVSAVAAIDNEDRIRSANAAFFRIFPNASIGASVLEKLGDRKSVV